MRIYCPRCSQVSEDLRFCPACGFLLTFVHQLLDNNGIPADANGTTQLQKVPLMRRPGFRNGAKLIFISFFLVPLAFILAIAFDSPGPLTVPLLVFLAGLAISLYTLLFVDPSRSIDTPTRLNGSDERFRVSTSMPPFALNQPRLNTAEMIRPVSVTEHTTTLLDEKNDDWRK